MLFASDGPTDSETGRGSRANITLVLAAETAVSSRRTKVRMKMPHDTAAFTETEFDRVGLRP